MVDKIGEETLEIMSTVGWYNEWLFNSIKKNLKGKILEVGAGIGNFTPLLATRGKVYAIDFNRRYLANLKKILPKNVKIGYGDIEKGKTDFKRVKFDTAICMNVLEHIKDDVGALENMKNLLSKGGKLILLVPAHNWAYGTLDEKLGHVRRYTKNSLYSKLEKVGFEINESRYLNTISIFGWFLNSRILKRTLIPRTHLRLFSLMAGPFIWMEKYIKFPFGLSLLVVARKK